MQQNIFHHLEAEKDEATGKDIAKKFKKKLNLNEQKRNYEREIEQQIQQN